MVHSEYFTLEAQEEWKKLAAAELMKLTQDLTLFTDYVHLYGRLTFDIDGKEKICIKLSEFASPVVFMQYEEKVQDDTNAANSTSPLMTAASLSKCKEPGKKVSKRPRRGQKKKEENDATMKRANHSKGDNEIILRRSINPLNVKEEGAGEAEENVMEEEEEEEETDEPEKRMEHEIENSMANNIEHNMENNMDSEQYIDDQINRQTIMSLDVLDSGRVKNVLDTGQEEDVLDKRQEEDVLDAGQGNYTINEANSNAEEDENDEEDDEDTTEIDDDDEEGGESSPQKKDQTKAEKCPHCQAQFTTRYRLDKHIGLLHVNTIHCPHCTVTFHKDICDLISHFNKKHPDEEVPEVSNCEHCQRLFETVEELQEHKERSHRYLCDFCSEVYDFPSGLNSHVKEIHADAEPVCNVCQRKFRSLKLLRKHRRYMHNTKQEKVKCPECEKICASAYALYIHQRGVHKKEGHYKCDICSEKFPHHNSLRLHKLHHNNERPFKCTAPSCDKSYLSSSHLKGHISAIHGIEKKFQCPICDKKFSYENSLKIHMRLHSGDRPFSCSTCGKGFVTRGALRNHLTIHDEGDAQLQSPSHTCRECGKTYRTAGLLRGHERRHTSDRSRYMCHVCGCTFMYQSNLETHALVHRDDKTFQCDICAKTFKTYATLYSHARVHQLDKPFMCEICAKGFKTKECLKAHTSRHSGEKPFKCTLCKGCFPDKGGLSKHLRTVHTENPNFQCPVCGKISSRADNLRAHMKSHDNPALLKLSREDLMITREDAERDVSKLDMVSVLLQSGSMDDTVAVVPASSILQTQTLSQLHHTDTIQTYSSNNVLDTQNTQPVQLPQYIVQHNSTIANTATAQNLGMGMSVAMNNTVEPPTVSIIDNSTAGMTTTNTIVQHSQIPHFESTAELSTVEMSTVAPPAASVVTTIGGMDTITTMASAPPMLESCGVVNNMISSNHASGLSYVYLLDTPGMENATLTYSQGLESTMSYQQ